MSFRTNKCQQISLNDRLNNLTKRERRFLEDSWAKPFGDRIFPLIDEKKFDCLYCDDNGRPNTPVNVVIGSLVLKELAGLTDEELLESIIFDARYQYALHLTSHDEIPYSDRTPSRFRERLYRHEMETGEDILKGEMERLGREFARLLRIHGNLKRSDSLMVSSSCKKMGRLELMHTCVSNLVKALVESGEGAALPGHLLKYAEEGNKNAVCYRMESGEVPARLEAVAADALLVYELCGETNSGHEEYQLLERMLSDQTKDGRLRPGKEISPQSLQNPSDEDATFRRKGGKGHQGYVANIVEDCGENANIITQYSYDANSRTDIDFCVEAIEKLGPQEETTVMATDGAYASEGTMAAAAGNNIELVPSSLSGKEPPGIVAEFGMEGNAITSCPEGHSPMESEYDETKETYRARFSKDTCENCPRRGECPAVIQKKNAVVRLSQSRINRARLIKTMGTERYKGYARKRNGIEGIPSVLRRRYGVDSMPVRGLLRSKMWFGFKIMAINVKRVIAATLDSIFFVLKCRLNLVFYSNIFSAYNFA